jgi:hypothetical protein
MTSFQVKVLQKKFTLLHAHFSKIVLEYSNEVHIYFVTWHHCLINSHKDLTDQLKVDESLRECNDESWFALMQTWARVAVTLVNFSSTIYNPRLTSLGICLRQKTKRVEWKLMNIAWLEMPVKRAKTP